MMSQNKQLLQVQNLKKYFPISSGVLFKPAEAIRESGRRRQL